MEIRAYIEKHNLSQAAFATLVGSIPANISRYINGERTPKPDAARRIVAATGGKVTLADIYK